MASSSTPSSITTLTKKHEVFLSFRGEDTRHGFTSHLDDALRRKQIKTFIDFELERGDEISPALLRAIQRSKIAVVIFSKNYASSKWCLRELVEIMKCEELHELIVMPVFYHVDPSDVRKQTGSFECYFANYEEKELQEEVQKWREALTEASNLSGWDSSVIRPDAKLVGEIVETVWRKLRSEYIPSSSYFEGIIGIHERIEQVMSLLCLDMEDVRKIIGIWGMGGIGKTTIAQAVFKFISYKFDGACFIEKVGKRLEKEGSDRLQLEVLSEVLHEENLKLGTPTIRPFIMEMLNQKRVFIVLDDVNDFLQWETLFDYFNRCGLGSRMIITSRDKQVLCNFKVDDHEIYEVERFNKDEALELFRKYANPTEDCMALSKKIVNYAKGNPLAIKVLGSSLKGKSKSKWENALVNLQGIVNSKIFDVLKISYDGLEEKEKNIFLDLACFKDLYNYHGLLKEEFLDCHDYSLSVLVAKSLITMETYDIEMHDLLQEMGREIKMHDLLQEMGREIVRRESPKKPGKRSRLWKRDDVIRTLKNNTGTDAVEVISLDMDNLEDIHLSSQVFDKMHNLRIILFNATYMSNKVHLPNCLNCLPDELIFLHWPHYPLRALPSNFNPEKLVKLNLSKSNIEELWKGTKHAPKLKWLILRECPRLTRIPNPSDFPLLVDLDLRYHKGLVDFPSSVQQLNSLWNLDLSGTAIEGVPSSIQSLTNFTELDLSSICSKLDKLPDNLGNLKSLKWLDVSGSSIGQLPSSITCLENLEILDCSGCRGLTRLPPLSGLHSLQTLYSNNCRLMEIPEDIGCLSSLKKLELSGNMFESLPKSINQLSKLKFLSLRDCKMLRSLPELPEGLECLEAMDCDQLCQVPDASEFVRCINSKSHDSTFNHCVKFIFTNSLNLKAVSNVFEESLRIMQRTEKGSGKPSKEFSIYLPGNKIPEWFSYQSLDSLVNIQVLRNDLVNRKFMGFAICAVFGFDEYNSRGEHCPLSVFCDFEAYYDHIEICNGFRHYGTNCIPNRPIEFIHSDHMLLGYCSFYSSFQNLEKLPAGDSDHVNISIEFKSTNCHNQLKGCAVHPIYAEPIEKIGATLQDIWETSGLRSDRSDDNDEEVEPYPKRICTQAINALDLFH